jgi:hypothetical protein
MYFKKQDMPYDDVDLSSCVTDTIEDLYANLPDDYKNYLSEEDLEYVDMRWLKEYKQISLDKIKLLHN